MNLDTQFAALYEETKRQVHAYLTAKCASCEDVEDLFQETYAELYSLLKRRGTDYIREPEALVIALARQHLRRHYRKTALRRRKETALPETEDSVDTTLGDIEALSVEEIVCERLDYAEVRTLVRACGVENERILRLYFAEGLTIAETARLIEKSESYVKNRLYRTLKRIRQEITKGEEV